MAVAKKGGIIFMLENRQAFLKRVMIVKPPFGQFAGVIGTSPCNSIPEWVGEACVGLVLEQAVLSSKKMNSVSARFDEWSNALKQQNPQALSHAAADWIEGHVFWGDLLRSPIENVQIMGDGKILEKNPEITPLSKDFLDD